MAPGSGRPEYEGRPQPPDALTQSAGLDPDIFMPQARAAGGARHGARRTTVSRCRLAQSETAIIYRSPPDQLERVPTYPCRMMSPLAASRRAKMKGRSTTILIGGGATERPVVVAVAAAASVPSSLTRNSVLLRDLRDGLR